MIDLSAFYRGEKTLAQIAEGITRPDLAQLTREVSEAIRQLVSASTDAEIAFVPQDAETGDGRGWTVAHIVAHATATAEESGAHALTLARGVPVEQRSRIEVPEESLSTVGAVLGRLEESQRMQMAMLEAWPTRPNLDLAWTFNPERFRPMNAIERALLGVVHSDMHREQIARTLEQARAQARA